MKFHSIIILFLISACQNKAFVTLQQLESNEYIYIKSDYKNKDSLILEIPIEYKIINNLDTEIDKSIIYMTHNGKLLKDLDDFIVYDKNQHDEILKTERKIKQQEELHLIIRENYIYITKNEARKIFSKYKIDKNIIEIQKSVKIISFNRFKKENPITMKQFINHQNDSIILSNYNKGDLIFTNRKKINW